MSESIHRYLDGELPRSGVPLPKQESLREMDEAIAAARSWVRDRDIPDLARRVMAALPEEGVAAADHRMASSEGARAERTDPGADTVPAPRSPGGRVISNVLKGLRWSWTPRPISVRPALAAALFAAALIVFGIEVFAPQPPAPAIAGNNAARFAPSAPVVYIQFRLDTADASDVALAGTFTEWKPVYTLHESAPGVWTVTVPLEPGVHDYLFIVDGERWVPDPAATPVDDGFGGTNSRLLLSAPQAEA